MAQRYGMLIFLLLSGIAICALSANLMIDALTGDRQEPFADLEGVTVETLVELADKKAYPEALTIGIDGNIYSGSYCTGEIWRISPQGELEIWLAKDSGIGAVSGMVFAPDGTLYVVDRVSCDPRQSLSKLKRVLPDQSVEDWGQVGDDELLNSLTIDRDGRIFATDTFGGNVRVYDEQGTASVWWELPEDPNPSQPTGIVYHPQNHSLIVADSRNGIIYEVEMAENGEPDTVLRPYEDSQHSLDGITLDEQGRVIFTSYDEDDVLRLSPEGKATRLAANFRDPSDVAYLDGRIYVTNFDGITLAPLIGWILDPSLPFTIDVIELNE